MAPMVSLKGSASASAFGWSVASLGGPYYSAVISSAYGGGVSGIGVCSVFVLSNGATCVGISGARSSVGNVGVEFITFDRYFNYSQKQVLYGTVGQISASTFSKSSSDDIYHADSNNIFGATVSSNTSYFLAKTNGVDSLPYTYAVSQGVNGVLKSGYSLNYYHSTTTTTQTVYVPFVTKVNKNGTGAWGARKTGYLFQSNGINACVQASNGRLFFPYTDDNGYIKLASGTDGTTTVTLDATVSQFFTLGGIAPSSYNHFFDSCANPNIADVYFAGSISVSTGICGVVVKANASSSPISITWQSSIFSTSYLSGVGYYVYNSRFNGVCIDSASNVYCVGTAQISSAAYIGIVVKYSSSGTILWQRYSYYGGLTSFDRTNFTKCVIDPQGDLLVSGYSNDGRTGSTVGLLFKIPTDGSKMPFNNGVFNGTNSVSFYSNTTPNPLIADNATLLSSPPSTALASTVDTITTTQL